MAGYLIANLEVTDAARFEEYRQKVVPVIGTAAATWCVVAICAASKAISRCAGL